MLAEVSSLRDSQDVDSHLMILLVATISLMEKNVVKVVGIETIGNVCCTKLDWQLFTGIYLVGHPCRKCKKMQNTSLIS